MYSQKTDSITTVGCDTIFRLHVITYPLYAMQHHLQGTVDVSFTIDSTCSVCYIQISNSLNEKYCDPVLIKDIRDEEKFFKKKNNSKCKGKDVRLQVHYKLD